MGCILASVFYRFWLFFGAMLGGKIEQKSIKNGIEKTIEKRRAARWPTRRSNSLRGCAGPLGRAQGEGVGGEVNFSPEGLRIVTTYYLLPKPPQPRGLVGFEAQQAPENSMYLNTFWHRCLY